MVLSAMVRPDRAVNALDGRSAAKGDRRQQTKHRRGSVEPSPPERCRVGSEVVAECHEESARRDANREHREAKEQHGGIVRSARLRAGLPQITEEVHEELVAMQRSSRASAPG